MVSTVTAVNFETLIDPKSLIEEFVNYTYPMKINFNGEIILMSIQKLLKKIVKGLIRKNSSSKK